MSYDALSHKDLEMYDARIAVWRFEYRTDATHAGSPIIPLAYMVEADWKQGGRWLGMLLRRSLTKNELNASDLETWPELNEPEPFLKGVFSEAWGASPGNGGAILLDRYSNRSALRMDSQKVLPELAGLGSRAPDAQLFGELTTYIWTFEQFLAPALKAPVIDLAKRKRRMPLPSHKDIVEVIEAA